MVLRNFGRKSQMRLQLGPVVESCPEMRIRPRFAGLALGFSRLFNSLLAQNPAISSGSDPVYMARPQKRLYSRPEIL